MKRLVVLGGGESGVGTAILGKKGYDVFVSDKGVIAEKYKNVLKQFAIAWEEQQHTEALIVNADVVMKSPGIPDNVPGKNVGGTGYFGNFRNRICCDLYRRRYHWYYRQ